MMQMPLITQRCWLASALQQAVGARCLILDSVVAVLGELIGANCGRTASCLVDIALGGLYVVMGQLT